MLEQPGNARPKPSASLLGLGVFYRNKGRGDLTNCQKNKNSGVYNQDKAFTHNNT
jgi:hypothetical protein